MEEEEVVGQVVGGETEKIFIREKSGKKIELGDLLVVEEDGASLLLQVYDLIYGSQIPQQMRELQAGFKLEGRATNLVTIDPELRNYVLVEAKAIAKIEGKNVKTPKTLPNMFSTLRRIKSEDLSFLTKPENPIYVGRVRSGSKILDVDVHLNGDDVLTHHVVIPATTGRGKSNLVKVMLWSILDQPKFGMLILDPHDEYYGRYGKGVKDHPKAKEYLVYYSTTPPPGANTLIINLRSILPWRFQGIVRFTDAQLDALESYYNRFRNEWIERIVCGEEVDGVSDSTLRVLQRKFSNVLGVYLDDEGNLQCRSSVFSDSAGEVTVKNIVEALENGKKVIIDTSKLSDAAELLIGSIVVNEVFYRYQKYKLEGTLDHKPVASIIIEEAPRVLGKDVLEDLGENIYSTVAREGRKFKVGLIAVTQLISLIPRQVLANMNTKIILGNEMSIEREAIIDSAAQDLSEDDRIIASLDKGEAIITSSFTKFAVPLQIPLFEDYIMSAREPEKIYKMKFIG